MGKDNLPARGIPGDVMQVLSRLGIEYSLLGRGRTSRFERVVPISDLEKGCLGFINRGSDSFLDILGNTSGAVILVERSWANRVSSELDVLGHTFIVVDAPRLVIARLMDELEMEENLTYSGIHPTAVIDHDADIHPSVSVGPYCVIGKSVLSEGVLIGPHTVIGHNVYLGSRVKVRNHCTIGGDGFGFAREASGALTRIPHIGSVIIEEDVELFPYVNVDRGTLTATTIRKGAKLDHYVHVGHNSEVGEDALVTAGAVLCGGSTVGARCWIGVGAIIKEKVTVGVDSTVGLGAVVIKDVSPGDVVAGVPARVLSRRKKGRVDA